MDVAVAFGAPDTRPKIEKKKKEEEQKAPSIVTANPRTNLVFVLLSAYLSVIHSSALYFSVSRYVKRIFSSSTKQLPGLQVTVIW